MDISLNGSNFNNAGKAGYIPIDSFNKQFGRAQSTADYQKSVESILQNKLGSQINGQINGQVNALPPISQVNADNFSPQAVADRIVGFVSGAIAQRAGNNDEAEAMLKEAKKGIEQGIKEARDILDGMGKLTGEVNATINETEKLISKGLEKLESGLDNDSDGDEKSGLKLSDTAQRISASGSLSTQVEQSSEASIEITTREGDKVNVNYSAFIQAASNESYVFGQQSSAYSADYSAQSSVSFQFSVEGNIDAGEQKAIESLLSDVGKLAESFFQGDVQAAFNASMALGFDSSELQSFALDFQQSTYVEVAQTYQQTQQLSNPVAFLPDTSPAPAIDVLSQLNEFLQQNQGNSVLEKPQDTIKSLLSGMLDLLSNELQPASLKSPLQNHIKNIIEYL